ncbi:MAG: hypothetical protein GXO26_08470 [Crenarchaeota archaeon]|nr:hypothetical protein [Thermoproteota archaeon]
MNVKENMNIMRKLPRKILILLALYYLGTVEKNRLVDKIVELCRDFTIGQAFDCGDRWSIEYTILDLALRGVVEYRAVIGPGGLESHVKISHEAENRIRELVNIAEKRTPMLVEKIKKILGIGPTPREEKAPCERSVKRGVKSRVRERLRNILDRLSL